MNASIWHVGYSLGRRGSDSRCCQPVDPARAWIDYTDDAHEAVRELETWLGGLSQWARDHELGRVDDLMEAAAYGRLEDTGDETTPIKPVRHDPEIYELRHTALAKKLRLYHGEPGELPDALVAVHRHIKSNDRHQQGCSDRGAPGSDVHLDGAARGTDP
jgi:hypothetical protein